MNEYNALLKEMRVNYENKNSDVVPSDGIQRT